MVEADLRWRFVEAEGELGLRSNFGGFVALMQRGVGGGGDLDRDPITEREASACERARAIDRILVQLVRRHVTALQLAHGIQRWPVHAHQAFGHLTGIALHSEAAERGWRRARRYGEIAGWLEHVCWVLRRAKGDAYLTALASVASVRREAERTYCDAATAYLQTRGTR